MPMAAHRHRMIEPAHQFVAQFGRQRRLMITGYRAAQRQQHTQPQIGLLLQQAEIAAFSALQPQVIGVADTRSP